MSLRSGSAVDPDAAAALSVPSAQPLRVVERLRSVDDRPVAVESVWFPPADVGPATAVAAGVDIDEALSAAGKVVDAAEERLHATAVTDPDLALPLGSRVGGPAVVVWSLLRAGGAPAAVCRAVLAGPASVGVVVWWRRDSGLQVGAQAVTDGDSLSSWR